MWLLLLGCAPLPPPVEGLPPAPEYASLHEEATQELRIVRQLETRLLMRATLVDEGLARAQALTLAHAHRDSEQEYEARLIELTERSRGSWVLVFAADDPAGREAFSFEDSGAWSLHLSADGARAEGVELTELDAEDPDLPLLYPQLNRWSSLWEARFSRQGSARAVSLDVASAKGQGAITWER